MIGCRTNLWTRSIATFDVTVLRYTLQTILVLSFAGSVSFGQQDFSSSLLEAAKGGDARAQNELAIAYSEGLGVRRSQRAAVHWFSKSAAQGYPLGACNFGLHYGRGAGVRRNRTLMMKWVFVANSLDGLKCQPAVYVALFQPTECKVEKGWEMAVAWLKAHPDLKNNHGQRPWMEDGEYAITVREQDVSVQLPIKGKRKCK